MNPSTRLNLWHMVKVSNLKGERGGEVRREERRERENETDTHAQRERERERDR